MSNIWLTLVWKEWHEHKWRLLSLTAIVLCVFLAGAFDEWETVASAVSITAVGYALLVPCFLGMVVCSHEHSQGTIAFVAAQPVPMWKVATVRLFAGIALLLCPLLVVGLCGQLIHGLVPQIGSTGFFTTDGGLPSLWQGVGFGGLMGLNLYAWIVAVVVNQRTELRAGLIGLVVTAILVTLGMWGLSTWDNLPPGTSLVGLIAVMSGPLCGVAWADMVHQSRGALIWPSAIWQGLVIVVLSGLMVARYGQSEPLMKRLSTWRTSRASLGELPRSPFASPARALLWMQWRQSVPVCLAGTVLMGLIVVTTSSYNRGFDPGLLAGLLMFSVVLAASLMLGTVAFVNDLEPKLYTFWRSRPISSSGWFWLRYVAGLFAIGVFFVLPILAVAAVTTDAQATGFLLLLPLLSLVVYSLGAFCACTVRHPVYSVILAACAALLVLSVPPMFDTLRAISIGDMLREAVRLSQIGALGAGGWYLFAAVSLAGAVSAAATVAAAMLLKRDIYLRS